MTGIAGAEAPGVTAEERARSVFVARKGLRYLVAAVMALLAIVLAYSVFNSERRFGQPLESTTPNHGEAAREFGGSAGFTVDVTQVDQVDGELVMHLRFRNTSSEQQRADPADFRLEDSSGLPSKPVFEGDCQDWGRVDLYPSGGGPQPLRDPGGTRAGAVWDAALCFREPADERRLTLVWEPDVAFGPLSVPVRIPIR